MKIFFDKSNFYIYSRTKINLVIKFSMRGIKVSFSGCRIHKMNLSYFLLSYLLLESSDGLEFHDIDLRSVPALIK